MNAFALFEFPTTLLTDLLGKFMAGIPAIFTALVLFLIGIIVSKIISKIVLKFLEGIKVDKLGEKLNEIEMVEKANVKVKISTVLSKIVYYVIMLFFAVAATEALQMPALSNMVSDLITFIPNLIVAMIWIIIGLLISEALRKVVQTACNSLGIPSGQMIGNFLFYFLVINVIISALGQAKINTEFLSQNISLVIAGAVGAFAIGYGLASKDNVSNFLASFYSKGKFHVGDRITIEGKTGMISEMDKSSLVLKTDTGKIIIPLSKLSKENVEIHS